MKSLENIHDSIDRARELAADVRSGRVRSDGEHAARVVARLCEYLDDVAAILADQYIAVPAPGSEQARLRDALVAEVPASRRAEGAPCDDLAAAIATDLAAMPGDVCLVVTQWLRAARAAGSQQ